MDIDTLRVLVTLASLAAFVGIVAWAYSGGPRRAFEEAAALPFIDEPADAGRTDAARGRLQ
jgi:cytochrome c oxidase cbb3-type subunit 4